MKRYIVMAFVLSACGAITAPLVATRTQNQVGEKGGGGTTQTCSKAVSALDASRVLIHLFENDLDSQRQVVADVNGDGAVSIPDALLILQKAVGRIDRFPVADLCASDAAFFPDPQPGCAATSVEEPGINPDGSCRKGSITTFVQGDRTDCDFLALVWGDVTANWVPGCPL